MSDFDKNKQNYSFFSQISTRWADNDIYGHINNVVYYSYFDTVANNFLIEKGGLTIQNADIVGFVVSSNCEYLAPIAHPEKIIAGFRVNRLGNSSVEYGIGIFVGEQETASAHGTFTHVFVNRQTNQSCPIPDTMRLALESALLSE